jgi:hypothetical protein
MWITFRLVQFDRCQDATGEPKGLVGQQSRDLLCVPAACRGQDAALSQNATRATLAQKKPATPKGSGSINEARTRDVSEASHRWC